MLRDYIINSAKFADATCAASAACKTGMAVVKTYAATGETFAPATAGDGEIYFVQKARVPVGLQAARADFSDWEDQFNNVASGELALLQVYHEGEEFGTDQYASLTNTDAGSYVTFTAGKAGKVSSGTSDYKFIGLVTEGGHTLARIIRVNQGNS